MIGMIDGPPQLAYQDVPGWWWLALGAAGIVVLATLTRGLAARDWVVPVDEQREMQLIAGTVVAIATVTRAMVLWAGQPVLIDVAVGVAAGYGLVESLRLLVGPAWRQEFPEPWRRSAMGWVVVGAAASLFPGVLSLGSVPFWGGDHAIALLSLGMVAYNGRVRPSSAD